jgi:hypothetical protein
MAIRPFAPVFLSDIIIIGKRKKRMGNDLLNRFFFYTLILIR